MGKTKFNNKLHLTCYTPNNIFSMCNQFFKINGKFYIPFLKCEVFRTQSVFYRYSTSQFRLAAFQMFTSHM